MVHTILFDVIGTTVREKRDTVIDSLLHSFEEHIGPINPEIAIGNRGKNKLSMIEEVLKAHNHPVDLAPAIYHSFISNFEKRLDNFDENEGWSETYSFLKETGIKVGIGTGLPNSLLELIMDHLGWHKMQFDFIGTSNEFPNGRPAPDMILEMMRLLNSKDGKGFLKIGDTVADIQEGKNANVSTAVILSGSQPDNVLLRESPDFVLTSLYQVRDLVEENKWRHK
jgi:phosphonatase-like hydrolase